MSDTDYSESICDLDEFHELVDNNDIDDVLDWICEHPDFDIEDDDDFPALLVAVSKQNYNMVRLLVDVGYEIEYLTHENETAIREAIYRNDIDMIKLFVEEYDADMAGGGYDEDPAIAIAANLGKFEIVKYLYEKNNNKEYVPEAIYKASTSNRVEILDFLIDKVGQEYIPLLDKEIVETARYGAYDTLKYLLDRGGNIEAKDPDGITPLQMACRYGCKNIVKFLLDRGANIMHINKYGYMPLHDACCSGYLNIAEMLLDRGADINAKNDMGNTTSHNVCRIRCCFDKVLKFLLDNGADIYAKNNEGKSPLLIALEKNKSVIEILIESYEQDHNKLVELEKEDKIMIETDTQEMIVYVASLMKNICEKI
jgi:cytohesin